MVRAGSLSSARLGRGARAAARRCRTSARTTSLRSGSSSRPRISRASRFSISLQLVELPTMSCPSRDVGSEVARQTQHVPCASRRTARWTGAADRSSPAWDVTLKPLCSRTATIFSPSLAARSTRCRSRGSRRPCATCFGLRRACAPTVEKCRPANVGIGASRWTPRVFSLSDRASAGCERPVGDGRRRRAEPPEPGRARDDSVAQRHALLALELVARLRVDLGDLHSLRADLRADPAARAVVDRLSAEGSSATR